MGGGEGKQEGANPGQPQVKGGLPKHLQAGSITCGLTLGPVPGKSPRKGPVSGKEKTDLELKV